MYTKKKIIILVVIVLLLPTLMFSGSRYFLNKGKEIITESPEEARGYFETASILNPFCGRSHAWHARTFYSHSDLKIIPYEGKVEVPKEALESYKKAIEKFSTPGWVFENLGEIYYNHGAYYGHILEEEERGLDDTKKAIDLLERVAEKKPNEKVYYMLGYLTNFILEEPEKAITYFEKAEEINPDYPYADIGMGQVYNLKERYGKAIEHFDKSLEIKSTPSAYNGQAYAFYQLTKNPKVAITYYQKANDSGQLSYEAYYNLVLMYAREGDRESVKFYLDKLTEKGADEVKRKAQNHFLINRLNLN